MADPMDRVEAGDTRQFFVTYSGAPTTNPDFACWMGSGNAVLVLSGAAVASSTTQYYKFLTPNTPGFYMFQFVASYTTGYAKDVGVFQVVRTRAMG